MSVSECAPAPACMYRSKLLPSQFPSRKDFDRFLMTSVVGFFSTTSGRVNRRNNGREVATRSEKR